jgi:protoporphyrin/coproporphyrin ferrochelatase
MSRTGVLVLGFGGPESIDDVRPFMCNLMDREPSDELVAKVCRRYLSIGGGSPITDIATAMAAGIEERLVEAGHDVPVRVGMRYWHPYVSEGVAELMDEGCDRIIAFHLSPFESKAASGAYREAIEDVQGVHDHLEIVEAPLLSTSPEFVDFWAGSTAAALQTIDPNDGAVIVFTAHSLPESDLVDDDPYVRGLEETAQGVADFLGMAYGQPGAGGEHFEGFSAFGTTAHPRPWFLMYQSKGARPGGWLGPQLEEFIPLVAASPFTAVVNVPIGFATDHLETLYDLDTIAAEMALDSGIEWARAAVPNEDPRILDAITELIAPLV